ncbi:MAG: PHP domain-containing protein [bacterium]
MSFIDLHLHTNFSDGAFSPEEVIKYAHERDLSAIAITDHDTTDGIARAKAAAEEYDIEVVPGIELSAYLADVFGEEIHILGYFIEWQNEEFQKILSMFKQKRVERAKEILQKLDNLGVHLDEMELFASVGNGAIGRLHCAKKLVEKGHVMSIRDAFIEYLGDGRPAFVPKMYLEPAQTIKIIQDVKGIPVLAHPNIGDINADIVKDLAGKGLKGLEVYCNKLNGDAARHFVCMAQENNLLVTGGSDCHGNIGSRDMLMGSVKVQYSILEDLKKYKIDNIS